MIKDSSFIIEEKRELRKFCREKQSVIDIAVWKNYGQKMSGILLESEYWKNSQSVFCYASMTNEPDTSAIISEALRQGKTLCTPRVVGNGIMQAVAIDSIDELELSTMGIREPSLQVNRLICFNQIDLVIVPCLAGAYNGSRLGKGGGYYDRFLSEFRGISVLMCPSIMILNIIPTQEHDIKCDYILTENELKKSI